MGRNNEDFITGSYKYQPDPETTNYFTGTGENALGLQSGAYASVESPKTRYYNPSPIGNPRRMTADANTQDKVNPMNTWDDVGDEGAMHWAYARGDDKGNIPLFDVEHEPPVLNMLFSTKDVKDTDAMKLASHALEDTRRRFGERPLGSDNTSQYATKLVNKAIQQGIIKGVKGGREGDLTATSNDLGWSDATSRVQMEKNEINDRLKDTWGYYPKSSTPTPISPAEMQTDAKNLVLEALSGKRSVSNPNKGRQFKQGELFSK